MIAIAQPLSEVFADFQDSQFFSLTMNDFVDRFREDPARELLSDAPALLRSKLKDNGLADAWLAATAVALSQEQGFQAPAWTREKSRYLPKPWFAAKTPNLRAILLQESPAAFRVRNLFVSANALSRA